MLTIIQGRQRLSTEQFRTLVWAGTNGIYLFSVDLAGLPTSEYPDEKIRKCTIANRYHYSLWLQVRLFNVLLQQPQN